MQMRAGRAAARADAAQNGARRDLLAGRDGDLREMAVARRIAEAMIQLDHIAIAA